MFERLYRQYRRKALPEAEYAKFDNIFRQVKEIVRAILAYQFSHICKNGMELSEQYLKFLGLRPCKGCCGG